MSEPLRLHRYLAKCGVASRRKAEDLIREGRVTVDGEVVTEMGTKVADGQDIRVDGIRAEAPRLLYYVLYKPKGVLTTMSDPGGRPTIAEYLPSKDSALKPVGRLDKDTDGLIIITNDGDLAMRLTHPRYGVEKEYEAVVKGIPTEDALGRLRRGVMVEGRRTAPAEVSLAGSDPKGRRATVSLILHEGRKRQVRLMCEAVGHPVVSLRRVRIGLLRLKGMRPGECRLIGLKDVQALRRLVGLE